jgi:hypothetical protein
VSRIDTLSKVLYAGKYVNISIDSLLASVVIKKETIFYLELSDRGIDDRKKQVSFSFKPLDVNQNILGA